MNAKHTPGPWMVKREGWRGQWIYGNDERVPGRRLIAEVSLMYDGAEANANLCAAAPDLLDALDACYDRLIAMGATSTADKARAAIAKARGEA